VKHYRPYTGRNPKTGAAIHVSPKKLPFFKVEAHIAQRFDRKVFRIIDFGDVDGFND